MKWTDENLKKEALKYKTRSSFAKNSASAYYTSIKIGILDQICKHMSIRFYWKKELLIKEALKYNSRIEFSKKNNKAYRASIKMCILDEICKHMISLGNLKKRFIYIIEFENRSVYIGLTNNLDRRLSEHILNSSNLNIKLLMKDNIKFKFNSDNILYDVNDAIEKEKLLIIEYNKNGFNVLNISKGGELGGNNLKWKEELIKKEALKYNKRSDFKRYSRGAYESAREKKILDYVCSHMKIKWTEESLKEEALKHKNRYEFLKNGKGAYMASKRRGILDKVCSHMLND